MNYEMTAGDWREFEAALEGRPQPPPAQAAPLATTPAPMPVPQAPASKSDNVSTTRLRTADELVAELLSGLSPEERAAWDAETNAMIATSRARLAKRERVSVRPQREVERKAKEVPEERERVGEPIHIADAPPPDHAPETMAALTTFLGDGPFEPADVWADFAAWNPLEP